ncbi:MAG: DoxX family membrane protein [Undibacterium sp.]|nr:DoxX family membrane protein [Opitutaceae bacterium]
MSENSSPAPAPRCEYTQAFLVLRLFLGLRALLAGLEKFESKGAYSVTAYSDNMKRMASGITGASFIPLWASNLFAQTIGYVLVVLGVAILLGIKSRCSLFLMGLTYVALSFGLMAVQEGDGVAWLGMHVALVAGALVLVQHNRFALWRD